MNIIWISGGKIVKIAEKRIKLRFFLAILTNELPQISAESLAMRQYVTIQYLKAFETD